MTAEKIGRRIAAARHEVGMTQAELAKAVGRSRNTVPNWESGQNLPPHPIMEKIASVTGKPLTYFYGGEGNRGGDDLAETVRRLERLIGSGAAQSLADAGGLAKVPVYGSAAAGAGGIADSEPQEFRHIPVAWIPEGQIDACILVEAHGDSMIDVGLSDGDLLLACPTVELSDGNIAVVEVGDEVLVKRVFIRDDTLVLASENAQVPPRIVPRSEVRWIARVMWARKDF